VPTLAILPVKSFDAAKQRLAAELPPGVRRALAQAMCADVLLALRRARRVDEIVVVSGELDAGALASGHAVEMVDDPHDDGQSAAARLGIARAVERGFERVVLVPGDCPAVDPGELDTMLAHADSTERVVVIVPDRHGTGTNALLLAPPQIIDPAFGAGSFARHRDRARAAGLEPIVDELPSLGLDVDTPEDLAALRAALEATRTAAPNTRGMLRQLERSERRAPAPAHG
jgi:2-phospho-L-lactate guanylyltransferase